MGRLMRATWVQFARTGDPNGAESLPPWPRFNPDTRPTLFFANDLKVVEKPYEAVWQIIQSAAADPKSPPI